MARNRLLSRTNDEAGAYVLRAGRVYRLLLVVTGQTTVGELGDRLVELGFDPEGLALTAPGEWAEVQPSDWPDEPRWEVCGNECLVRASGPFEGEPIQVERDTAIGEGGALLTIAAAWDYISDQPRRVATGAAAPAADASEPNSHRGLLICGALFCGAMGVWVLGRGTSREVAEQDKLRRTMLARERDLLIERTQELMLGGKTRAEAETIAEREAVARVDALAAMTDEATIEAAGEARQRI